MLSNIAERSRSQERITDRMQKHIRIGMSEQSGFRWNLNSAQNKFSTLCKAMDIISNTDSRKRIMRNKEC